MELKQFTNLSSWREDTLTINAKSVGELDFNDTTPNHFVVQNPNDCIVYIGIAKTPTDKNYEYRIPNNSNDVFGRPTPTRKVMFYNPSDETMVLKVFSVFKEFEMLTLKNMSALIENATVITDGIVKGFSDNTSLPSGDNLIGRVEVEGAKDYEPSLTGLSEQLASLENRFGGMNVNLESLISKNETLVSNSETILSNIDTQKFISRFDLIQGINFDNANHVSTKISTLDMTWTLLKKKVHGYISGNFINNSNEGLIVKLFTDLCLYLPPNSVVTVTNEKFIYLNTPSDPTMEFYTLSGRRITKENAVEIRYGSGVIYEMTNYKR